MHRGCVEQARDKGRVGKIVARHGPFIGVSDRGLPFLNSDIDMVEVNKLCFLGAMSRMHVLSRESSAFQLLPISSRAGLRATRQEPGTRLTAAMYTYVTVSLFLQTL